jgi:hypothetical protein
VVTRVGSQSPQGRCGPPSWALGNLQRGAHLSLGKTGAGGYHTCEQRRHLTPGRRGPICLAESRSAAAVRRKLDFSPGARIIFDRLCVNPLGTPWKMRLLPAQRTRPNARLQLKLLVQRQKNLRQLYASALGSPFKKGAEPLQPLGDFP